MAKAFLKRVKNKRLLNFLIDMSLDPAVRKDFKKSAAFQALHTKDQKVILAQTSTTRPAVTIRLLDNTQVATPKPK